MIKSLLKERFPKGSRVLFHLDQHTQMRLSPVFLRAVFQALVAAIDSSIPGSKCVATCTDIPSDIPNIESSGVPLPCVNLVGLFKAYPDMSLNNFLVENPNREDKQKCSTLAFRLAFKQQVMCSGIHQKQSDFRDNFVTAVQNKKMKTCFDLTSFPEVWTKYLENAVEYMNGMEDKKYVAQADGGKVVSMRGKLYGHWRELLKSNAPVKNNRYWNFLKATVPYPAEIWEAFSTARDHFHDSVFAGYEDKGAAHSGPCSVCQMQTQNSNLATLSNFVFKPLTFNLAVFFEEEARKVLTDS